MQAALQAPACNHQSKAPSCENYNGGATGDKPELHGARQGSTGRRSYSFPASERGAKRRGGIGGAAVSLVGRDTASPPLSPRRATRSGGAAAFELRRASEARGVETDETRAAADGWR